MKHAGPTALDALEPLLEELRSISTLKERSRGIFYVKSRAFLHFHEDPVGVFADIRDQEGADFDRFKLDTPEAWPRLIALARARSAG